MLRKHLMHTLQSLNLMANVQTQRNGSQTGSSIHSRLQFSHIQWMHRCQEIIIITRVQSNLAKGRITYLSPPAWLRMDSTNLGPHLTPVSWTQKGQPHPHTSMAPWSVHPFLHSTSAGPIPRQTDRQTNKQTDSHTGHTKCNICRNTPHLMHCVQQRRQHLGDLGAT